MNSISFSKTILLFITIGILSCTSKPKEEKTAAEVDTLVHDTSVATKPEQPASTEVSHEPEEETSRSKKEAPDPIDQVYEDCVGTPENQTTVGMCDCAGSAQEAWDKQMNEYYTLLMGILKEDEKAKLKIAQQKWLAFRDAEFEFSGTAYYNMEGTMYRVMAVERQKEFVKARALELKLYHSVFAE